MLKDIVRLLQDKDAEVRAQTAKVLGNVPFTAASGALIRALRDENARVRFFAAISLSKLGDRTAIPALVAMLRANADKDVYHPARGGDGIDGAGEHRRTCWRRRKTVRARCGWARCWRCGGRSCRRWRCFCMIADELIVLEAARAINDLPMNDEMPALAALIVHPTKDEPLDWRVINANFRVGEPENAVALAKYATQANATEKVRVEALHALETWAAPSPRDRITGFWLPLDKRDGKVAAEALRPVVGILLHAPETDRRRCIWRRSRRSKNYRWPKRGRICLLTAKDGKESSEVRVEALKALAQLHDARLLEAVNLAVERRRRESAQAKATSCGRKCKPGDAAGATGAGAGKGQHGRKAGGVRDAGRVAGGRGGQSAFRRGWTD